MSRSPDQSPRWPSDRRPLALRADDFDRRRSRRASADLSRRLDGWARGVVSRLAELGVDAQGQSSDAGDAAQVRFVTRGTSGAESAGLVLRIEATRVRAGLEVPAAQARVARVRLSDPARALELATALEVLPEQFTMGASSDPVPVEAPRATAADLRNLLERVDGVEVEDRARRALARADVPGGVPGGLRGVAPSVPGSVPACVWVGWTVPRALALEHAAMLDEQLEDAIAALAQLFALFVTYASDLDERARGEGPRFSGRRTGQRKGGRRKAAEGERDRARGDDARARDRGREQELEAEGEETEPEPAREAPGLAARRTDTKLLSRPPSRRRPLKAAEVVIERGARVRVLKGPFSGKVGVVQELDAKGGARVMLGLLAVRLEVTNLMPCVEGRGRPVLSSSHRKPIPARS